MSTLRSLLPVVLVMFAAAPVAADVTMPEVTLVTAGREPRRALRYTPQKGTKYSVTGTVQRSEALGEGSERPPLEKQPTMRIVADAEVTGVTAAGDIQLELVARTVEAVDDPALTTALASLAGSKTRFVFTDRGFPKPPVDQPATPDIAPEHLQIVQDVRGLGHYAAKPLPRAPIGVGAKWKHTVGNASKTSTVKHTASYELVELAGTRCKIRIVSTLSSKTPTGKTSATSTDEITFDLARAAPVGGQHDTRVDDMVWDKEGRSTMRTVTSTTLTSQ